MFAAKSLVDLRATVDLVLESIAALAGAEAGRHFGAAVQFAQSRVPIEIEFASPPSKLR
jgi:hypothetical protein